MAQPTKTMNIIFNCAECNKYIIEDSKDHDECICNEDGDRWWCEMCHNCDECKKNTKWCWPHIHRDDAVSVATQRTRIKSLEDAERKWGRLTYNDADFTDARGGSGADFTDCYGAVRWHPDHGSYSITDSSSDEDEDDHPQCEYCGRFSEDHTKQFICNECDVCYFCNNTGDRSVGCACCEKEVKSVNHL